MFKKAGDNVHYLERTGSHATKGTGRGTVWWYVSGPGKEELDAARLHELKKLREVIQPEWDRIVKIHTDAGHARNGDLMRAVRPAMRKLEKNLKAIKKEIKSLKAALRDPV